MEKLLAMSILSSTSAEVSGGSWMMNISLFKNGKKSSEAAENSGKSSNSSHETKQRPLSTPQSEKADANKQQQQQQQKARGSSWRPSFAPEFDGLNCFETIISH